VNIGGSNKPADNATADLTLVASGVGLVLVGNNCDRPTGGGGWDAQVYSRDGYTGGAFCSFVPSGGTESHFMAGLNTDPAADASFTSLDYAFYMAGSAPLYAYESGVSQGVIGTYVAGDVLTVTYDGASVRYLKNGDVLRTVAALPNLKLFFDSSIVFYGLGGIRVGPMSKVEGIGSGQLVPGAATDPVHTTLANDTWTVPTGATANHRILGGTTWVNPLNEAVLVEVSFTCFRTYTNPAGAHASNAYHFMRAYLDGVFSQAWPGATNNPEDIDDLGSGQVAKRVQSYVHTISVPAGKTLLVESVMACQSFFTGTVLSTDGLSLRLAALKR
jgi:hypothetical protein